MGRRVLSVQLPGPAGRLEALLEEPEGKDPREAVVLCHPHPNYGGTMHNKVVYRLARALRETGSAVLRFNFRGAGRSQGAWDRGRGELEDARSALKWLRNQYPGLPYALAGFSFGARIALELGSDGEHASRIIAAGFPLAYQHLEFLNHSGVARYFLHSTNDEHAPQAAFEEFFERLSGPKRLIWIPSKDHFFAGGLDELEKAARALPRGE